MELRNDDDDCYRFWRALFRKKSYTRRQAFHMALMWIVSACAPHLNAVEISSKKVRRGNEWPQWCDGTRLLVPLPQQPWAITWSRDVEKINDWNLIAERYKQMRNDPRLLKTSLKISRSDWKGKYVIEFCFHYLNSFHFETQSWNVYTTHLFISFKCLKHSQKCREYNALDEIFCFFFLGIKYKNKTRTTKNTLRSHDIFTHQQIFHVTFQAKHIP